MSDFDLIIYSRSVSRYSHALMKDLDDDTLLLIVKAFAVYLQGIYLEMIQDSINSKRYEGKWEPVEEEKYIEYLGTTPEVEIISLIKDAVVVKKFGYNYKVMIDPRYRYPKSKLSLLSILRAIEYGTSGFSARPIFRKTVSDLRKNLSKLWRGFLFAKGVI